MRDTLDPRYLFHAANEAFDEQPGDDGDVVLKAWSARKTAAKLKKEAERAEVADHRLEVVAERLHTDGGRKTIADQRLPLLSVAQGAMVVAPCSPNF
jgi:hypothetical protein